MNPPGGAMLRRGYVGFLLLSATCLVTVFACAGQERRRILTLLFDGVPEEETAQPAEQASESEPGRPAPTPRRTITLLDPSSPKALTVSANHATFAANCGACHQEDVAVTDERCTVCHAIGLHQDTDVEMTCGSCHVEHSGRLADLTRMDSDRCTDCHDAHPFENEHPQFSLLDDAAAAAEAKYARGVEVFHSIHTEMEVLEGDREGEPLHCFDCHRLDPMRPLAFEPPAYEQACSSCHELEALHKSIPEAGWNDARQGLPDGADVNQALLTDARWGVLQERLKGGPELAALAEAREKMADQGLADCLRCHSFADAEIDGRHYAVVPPIRHRPWFPSLRFRHGAHAFLDCRQCHVVPEDSSAELGRPMLPSLEQCSGCHRQGGASNACSTCHTFHARTPRFESDTQRQKRVMKLLNLPPES